MAWAQAAGTVLPPNALPTLRGVVSGQVVVRAPTLQGAGSLLSIDQASSRAVIDWRSFNIGSASEVRFNQPGTTASVLNRIYSADPTVIQGRLSSAGPIDPATGKATAGGQIILVNQNGILFDRGSQVNAYSLIASTLNISNDFFNRGLLSGEDPGRPVPAFAGGYRIDGDGSTDASITSRGAIRIGASGSASSAVPTIGTPAGGNIMLFAPVIENRNGLIAAPDGQVILAAGHKVYLSSIGAQQQGLRGFLVEVAAESGDVNLSSLIRNMGDISADRGNVTLNGLALNQEGRVTASTAVLYNGSVWLKATSKDQGAAGGPLEQARAGTVMLGAGSVTATPLDTADKTTLAESVAYASANAADDRRGRILVSGKTIDHRGSIEAPGGLVSIQAASPVAGEFGRVYLAEGSRIDASGHWADVDYDSNFATFRVTSTELKDAPDQKDGILKGATVTVDLRKGSSILDLSGYVDGRRRSVGEKASVGGSVDLVSSGDVIQRAGAEIDVSGGGYRYEGGTSKATQVLGDDGKVYDLAVAPQQRTYTAQLDKFTQTFARWGQTRVYDTLLGNLGAQESGYVEGRPGGSLSIVAPRGLVLDGELAGGATVGPTQLSRAPLGGSLTLGTNLALGPSASPVAALRFSAAPIDHLGTAFEVGSVLSQAQSTTAEVAAETLFPEVGRFGSIEVNSRGKVELPSGVELDAGIGTSVVLRGAEVDIGGDISAPAGRVALQGTIVARSDPSAAPEQVTVRSGASISTAGVWRNMSRPDGSAVGALLPLGYVTAGSTSATSTLQGGTITITGSAFDVQPTSLLDVSGGGSVDRAGRITAGNGGSIGLTADRTAPPTFNRIGGDLRGYSLGGTGGSLSLNAFQVQIGGDAATPDFTLRLDEGFFTSGGFSSWSVTSQQSMKVVGGTHLRPVTESWALSGRDAIGLASGDAVDSVATRAVLRDDLRPAASLNLSSSGSLLGESTLTLEEGASITTDPRGRVTLDAVSGLNIDGRVEAPAGSITLSLRGVGGTAPVIKLSDSAQLLAGGTFIAKPSDTGLRQGTVLAGGSVSISATRGSIDADAGSLIDVSGTSRTLDFASVDAQAAAPTSRVVGSSAGTVILRAQERSSFDSRIVGQAGTATSAGGSFAVEFTNRQERLQPSDTSVDRRIVLTQAPSSLPQEAGVVDMAVDSNRLFTGGFDKLRLQAGGRIEALGQVSLDFNRSVQLDTPELRLGDWATLNVDSAAVVFANSFGDAVSSAFQGTNATRNNNLASRVIATQSGTGAMNVRAGTIDVLGDVTVNGASSTKLSSDGDLRLSGRTVGDAQSATGAVLTGSLVSAGDLTLTAAQVLPTTRSTFLVAVQSRSANGATADVPGGTLAIGRSERTPGAPLSADGALTLRADKVEQGGTVRAPLGRIKIEAGTALTLQAGSLTSVSADGLTLPFGSTIDQRDWIYTPTNGRTELNGLVAPPSKAITLKGPSIDLASGAVVDLKGGGNVQAYEFVPGSGGSADTLLKDNTFAIMPAAQLTSMPVDREIAGLKDLGLGLFTSRPDALAYDAIHVGAGAAVPAGDYVLLPGRYAVLPGAYVVTLQTGSTYANLQPGQVASLANGQVVVPGYRKVAGTAIREDATIGVVVRAGSSARRESDYTLADASFFAERADKLRQSIPPLPGDGGRLSISATRDLKLEAQIASAPEGENARVAQVDIAAPRIAVVDSRDSSGLDATYLKLDAANLSRIGGSLLIGGTRTDTADGVQVQASSSDLVVSTAGESLQAPELMLTATEQVIVRAGSVVRTTGKAVDAPAKLSADSEGALIRLASGDAAMVDRGMSSRTTRGSITVESGAKLSSTGSMTLDATRSLVVDGALDVATGGQLSLAAGSVTLGDAVPGTASNLQLGSAALRGFDALGSLTLKSYGTIDLVGNVVVGAPTLDSLVLDAPRLKSAGSSPVDASLRGQNITLRNSSAAPTEASTGSGRLTLDAETLTLGQGTKVVEGFGEVTVRSSGDVIADGVGTFWSAAPTTISAARVRATPGSDQLWRAAATDSTFDLTLSSSGGAAAPSSEAQAGGRLTIEGQSVLLGTKIVMPSGIVGLSALGSAADDGIAVSSLGAIDVGSYSKTFADRIATADAGTITLSAAAGSVSAAAGSKLNLAGAASGGDAGTLTLSGASVQLAGTLDARAEATGAIQGRVSIDVSTLGSFSTLNSTLNDGGFSEQRLLRVRNGDILVAATDVVKAHDIVLSADRGRIDVNGRLDASGVRGGGRVALFAGTDLRIAGGIDASGTSTDGGAVAAPSRGGVVVADTRGTLTVGPDAVIDVRPGAKGAAGRAEFVAPAGLDGSIAVDLRGNVTTQRSADGAAGEVVVQGRRVVTSVDEATPDRIAAWATDHTTFMGAANPVALTGGLRTDGSRHVRGVLELQASGDFALSSDWDLTTAQWLAGSGGNAREPGTLTIRAVGDILISRLLGMPDDKLVDGQTWSMQFAAGADLSAANPLGLQPLSSLGSKGNFRLAAADSPLFADLVDPNGTSVIDPATDAVVQVTIDQAAKVRTGSGSISIAAGRDFVFERGSLASEDAKRVIYTAGRPTAPADTGRFVQGLETPWADGGGDITIQAQRDAIGDSNQWINGWLRRPRGGLADADESGWFVYRPNFQQNVGALGGGNVTITVANDVLNLSAAVPTMGRVTGTQTTGQQLEVTGGGDLSVSAGNRIEGGDYLVSRGRGSLRAGSSVGVGTPTQLFLMGESDDFGQRGAGFQIDARSDVRIQSVDNPTVLNVPQARALGKVLFEAQFFEDGTPVIDDSTGLQLFAAVPPRNFVESALNANSNYFTYAPNSSLGVASLAGDITLGGRAVVKPALTLASPAFGIGTSTSNAVYPGIVSAVAFDGAIRGTDDRPLVTLFSTPRSSLSLLAATDLSQLNLSVSDRASSGIASWERPSVDPSSLLAVGANTPRNSFEASTTPFRYDLVAASGSARSVGVTLPDDGRVQAQVDIVGGSFQLQNREDGDVSVLRAVQGDVRPTNVGVSGSGQLLVQAGRNIDAGSNAVQAIGNTRNATLSSGTSARLIFIAGVTGHVDLAKLDGWYKDLSNLNQRLNDALALYKLLNSESDPQRVLNATSVEQLAQRNSAYQPFVELGKAFPRVLGVYQDTVRSGRVPLGPGTATSRSTELYAQLNAETDPARLQSILKASSLSELAANLEFSAAYSGYVDLDRQFPTLFSDYRVRRGNGFTPTSVLPAVYGSVLDEAVAKVFPGTSVARGSIDSFLTSLQTIGGSGIDLIAPAGDITVGLTTPRAGREVGVLTTGGGDIRSYLSGNFNINQGKVVTAQGGDILIFSSRGNIDAGRGARTSQTSPAPVREPILEDGVVVGFISKIPAGFSGSGIQTLSSDPDGQGPLPPASAGTVLLFTPAGFVDAGEAGIVSGGDLVIVAQTVLNAANISAGGASVGVPVAAAGSLASSLASGGTNTSASARSGEEGANASASAARAAAAAQLAKPTILVVEVLGFGDRNCKEQDKDCFAK